MSAILSVIGPATAESNTIFPPATDFTVPVRRSPDLNTIWSADTHVTEIQLAITNIHAFLMFETPLT
jgi:hypothetical protein